MLFLFYRLWSPQLLLFAKNDHYLKQHFMAAGWQKNTSNDDLIRKLYLKLTLGLKWRYLNAVPAVEDLLLQKYIPENFHVNKVTAFIAYKDKIFLSLANGTIERRNRGTLLSAESHSDSLQEPHTIHSTETIANVPLNGQINDENHIIGR